MIIKKLQLFVLFFILFNAVIYQTSNVFSQTNPTPQQLKYEQDFGWETFTIMPTGMAAWTVSDAPMTSFSNAEESVPNGDAIINEATSVQTTAGCYGFLEDYDNAKFYIQVSGSDTINGTN